MKKIEIGIVLAALVIATFMVGTAAALQQIIPPQQEEYFTEKSSVQGTGNFSIMKQIEDKDIAVGVNELIQGYGYFCMESKEILNESVDRCRCPPNCTCCKESGDIPPCGCTPRPPEPNYVHNKMIQFGPDEQGVGFMMGSESYTSPSFHGGTGASVKEYFAVTEMQKMETVGIHTTALVCEKQSLNFDTMDQFKGMWGTSAVWTKPCKKKIELEQMFEGDFAVQKQLIFEEDVTKCGKKDC